jgi:signal transduction histidine kinase
MPFVWIMLASIVGLLILSPLFFHASLVAPLRRVLKGVRSVNDGNLDAEVTVGVRDEIGYLAQNFNHMTQSLRRYAGEMEGLVAERTSELEASLVTIKNAQAQLIQQEKLASLGQMTAGIAHEIKNPLNFVNNFAELNDELFAEFEEAVAKGEPVDELIADLRSNTHQISENGKRADGIVRSMLQHAHTGERTVARVDINALVDEYVTLSFHSAKSRIPDFNVKLIRSLSPSAGEADIAASDISRVLINLIGNAFDAIKEHGGTTVTVSTSGSEDWVEIRVSDDGPGMSESIQQRIFEPFFTTKPTGSGTGLGLSLSYDIVTAGHGGTMTVESTPGEGATFVVTLPRKLA